MKENKKIAVIGAGAMGLAAIKGCLEENLQVTAYEKNDDMGGLWRFREEVTDGQASVMKSTVINTSKEMSAFSDYPPPPDFPNFMHNRNMLRYFRMYAKEFDLIKHIRFNHEILFIAKNDDYDETGRWRLKIRDLRTNTDFEDVVDGVMLCTGHHAHPKMASFPGMESFKGKIIHSHGYRVPNGYEDKNVLVIGIGNSGVDVAVELGAVSKAVYLSTRRGAWVVPRTGPNGKPIEFMLTRRLIFLLAFLFPKLVTRWVEWYINFHFSHDLYDIKPEHGIFNQHPTVNDLLRVRVLAGTVTIKGDVKHFTENGVVFVGDNREYPIDAVVMATGYFIKFPYLEKGIISFSEDHIDLYKFMFPPQLKHPSFVFIGMVQSLGAIFPIGEMQSRWFAQLMIGNVKLPPREDMEKDIATTAESIRQHFYGGWRHVNEVNFILYLDDVARQIGAKPNLRKLLFKDPKLFWHCLAGPCVPYQYRLMGPRPWSGARQAILDLDTRVAKALNTRTVKNVAKMENGNSRKLFLFFLAVFTAFCVYLFKS